MKTPNATTQQFEIQSYVNMAKNLEGEITISRLISELRIGHNKAKQVMEAMGLDTPTANNEPEIVEELARRVGGFATGTESATEITFEKLEEAYPVVSAAHDANELAIVEAACAPVNIGVGLGNVLQRFDLGDDLTQCKPKDGLSDAEIASALPIITGVQKWTEFALGDIINELEARGHENVIHQVISHLNLEDNYQTLYRYAKTSKATPNELRGKPGMSFSHYAEIACAKYSKDPAEQAKAVVELIEEVSVAGMNVAQVRAAVKAKQGKEEKPTPPPEIKPPRYIIIDKDGLGAGNPLVYLSDREPLCDEGKLCIDTESQAYSTKCEGNRLHTWMPMVKVEDEIPEMDAEAEDVLG